MPTASTSVTEPKHEPGTAMGALRTHWPEYLIEAAALGLFMVAACCVTVLVEHPASPVRRALGDNAGLRRALIGVAMGLTAVGLICSKWGKRSGAHMNPSVTLTFLMLGKISTADAVFYVCAQFLGGAAGVLVAKVLVGAPLWHPAIDYAVTLPGVKGVPGAVAAEFVISALMMTVVLTVSNSRRLSRYTPYFAGLLVALFITFEAPLSGMSMNPARTLGSALNAGNWTDIWVYFAGPPAGMLAAGAVYVFRKGAHRVYCAKFHHHNNERCIFRCGIGNLHAS